MAGYVKAVQGFSSFLRCLYIPCADCHTCLAPIAANDVFGSKPCDETMMTSFNKVGASLIEAIPPTLKEKIERKIALDLTLYKEANGLFDKRIERCA